MRLDPRLLKQLEAREDANEVLAEMLGVCPTCGQSMPGTTPRTRDGSKREAIKRWRTENPQGSQSQCSRDLGVSQAYVGRIWHEKDEANSPQDEASE